MNNIRRKAIQKVIDSIEELKEEVETLAKEEQECFENIPESFYGSERYERAEQAVDNLESASFSFEELIDYLNAAIE